MTYRIKHIPSGFYYQPHKHRGNNLSSKGKIYHTEKSAKISLGKETIKSIELDKDSIIYKELKDKMKFDDCKWAHNQVRCITPISDWSIEKIQNNSLPSDWEDMKKELYKINSDPNRAFGLGWEEVIRILEERYKYEQVKG